VPVSAVSKVADFCKQQFKALGRPNALTYLNECAVSFQGEGGGPGFERPGRYRSWIRGSLPASLDIISVDNYELTNSTRLFEDPWYLAEPRENRKFYQEFVYPTLAPHQRVLLVPGLYGNLSETSGISANPAAVAVQDGRLTLKMEEYWKWAQEDPLVIGFNPYHWGDEAYLGHGGNMHMCYTGISCNRPATCGGDAELFGAGPQNYPRLMSRMREIGFDVARNANRSAAAALARSTTNTAGIKTDDSALPSAGAVLAAGRKVASRWTSDNPMENRDWTGSLFTLGLLELYKATVSAGIAGTDDLAALNYVRRWAAHHNFELANCSTKQPNCVGTGGNDARLLEATASPAAVVTWGSYPVVPGQTVLLSGSSFPVGCEVSIHGVNSGRFTSVKAIAEQSSSHSIKFVLPKSLMQDVFEISVAGSRPYFLNAPDVWSVHGDLGNTSTPGGNVRLMGRGLAAAQGRGDTQHSQESDNRAAELIRQLTEAMANDSSGSRSEALDLTTELQRLLSAPAATPAAAGGSTQLRLVPTTGGAPVVLTASWTDEEFQQRGDFSADFAIPASVPLGVYEISVAVMSAGVAARSGQMFFNVSTFVSPETPRCTTLIIRPPLAYKPERFVVERPPPGKRTPTCKGDYGTKPGSPNRAFDSLPALQVAFSKAIAKCVAACCLLLLLLLS
jgi:hypothetical protein